MMHVLLCILVWTINCLADHNSPLDHALKFHCETSDCTTDTSDTISSNIEFRLEGSGFHRRLHYSLELTCLDEKVHRPPLSLAIIQPLPAAIYANIYELDSAFLAGGGPEVRLFGEVDVESIEKFAQPTALAIYSTATEAATAKEGNAVRGSCGAVNVSIPLHGRYPRAAQGANKSEPVCWNELLKGILVDIKLPAPTVLMQSAAAKQWSRAKHNEQLQTESLVWSLPAGDMRLQTLTSAITAAVLCASAALVVHSIFFSRTDQISSSFNKKRRV
ncbi:hypothetical protein NADE_005795 [Nannochloris sp. 'desiccata']|nr:hypothetical protein NADE_005795 [Chlorella desiccata (nom. nud.)]